MKCDLVNELQDLISRRNNIRYFNHNNSERNNIFLNIGTNIHTSKTVYFIRVWDSIYKNSLQD